MAGIAGIASDFRFALRRLIKAPVFSLVAVVTLALGIGANTAIFSVVDRLLVRSLPVPKPERLALLGQPRRAGQVDYEFNYPLFRDFQRDNRVFSELSAVGDMEVGLGTGGATERQRALLVSGNFFGMLGLEPAVGRLFARDEGAEIDDAPVVVISHGLWLRRFGADPQVIGRSVTINGRPVTIIGVAPREFAGPSRLSVPDLYLPITLYGQLTGPLQNGEHPLRTRFFTWLRIMGRLRDSVSHREAETAMTVLAQQIYLTTPANTSTNVAVLPGGQGFAQDLREARLPLGLLLGAAGLVLLIACANLANLQLARATNRTRDFAICLALGAGRHRLVRGLLTESVLLAVVGGALGIGVSQQIVRLLQVFRPANAGFELAVAPDPRVLWFAFGAAVLTGVLFGLTPALRASRPAVVPELKGGAGSSPSSGGRWGLRSGLVVLQVSLSLWVLISAGLCLRSLVNLQRLDPGFDPSRVVLLSLDLGLNRYSTVQADSFYERLIERVRTLPGVEAASLGITTPLSGRAPAMSVERVEGYEPGPNERPFGDFNIVDRDYFRTLGVPMLRGRDFGTTDLRDSLPVVIVNEAFARRYWPGQDPLGKRIVQHGPAGGTPTEVVGVVGTTRNRQLSDAPRPAFYFPMAQKSDSALTLAVKTGLDVGQTTAALRQVVASLDPNVPIFNVRTLDQQKADSLALQRMVAVLLAGFGVLALLLASLGIYGVLAYSIGRRTREIGVRMALGAQANRVLRDVLAEGLRLTAAGLLLGLLAALITTRFLRGFLFDVQPFDPLTLATGAGLLGAVAILACWLPARRATQVDPLLALRAE